MLKEEQEVLGQIADIVIEVYAIESALARTGKLIASRGEAESAVAIDIARCYASDGADRIVQSATHTLKALAARERRPLATESIHRFLAHDGVERSPRAVASPTP
jgi:hypothetical protein